MADEAKRKMEDQEVTTNGKKRKGKKGGRASKKQKKNDASAAALKTAQDKHKANVGGERPIFIQPPLLANGCVLKDYQLEGVRWLTSLFENGVSGILADEMVRFLFVF
jgi:ATP-dependent DNA helicase